MTLAEILAQTAPENIVPMPPHETGGLAHRLRERAKAAANGGKTNRQANVAAKRARTLAERNG